MRYVYESMHDNRLMMHADQSFRTDAPKFLEMIGCVTLDSCDSARLLDYSV